MVEQDGIGRQTTTRATTATPYFGLVDGHVFASLASNLSSVNQDLQFHFARREWLLRLHLVTNPDFTG